MQLAFMYTKSCGIFYITEKLKQGHIEYKCQDETVSNSALYLPFVKMSGPLVQTAAHLTAFQEVGSLCICTATLLS